MGLFGFLTDSDLTDLRVKDIDLQTQVKILTERNENLKARVEALEKYCYNLGGDVALLRRQRSNDVGFGITVH